MTVRSTPARRRPRRSSPRAIRCRASVPRGRPAWASAPARSMSMSGKVFVGHRRRGLRPPPGQGLAVVGVSPAGTGAPTHGGVRTPAPSCALALRRTGPGSGSGEGRARRPTASGSSGTSPRKGGNRPPRTPIAWRYGGGSIYATPVMDTERKLLIFGTGNPSPQMADASRPGDNLHTSSPWRWISEPARWAALPAGAQTAGIRRRELAGAARGRCGEASGSRGCAGREDRLGVRA